MKFEIHFKGKMFKEIPYQDLLRDHPHAVAEAIADLRKGRSKFKSDPPENFTWGYGWCVEIEGSGSLQDLFMGQHKPQRSIDDEVADYAKRCRVAVVMSRKSGCWSSGVIATPQSFLNEYREKLVNERAEQSRHDAMSPAERQKEVDDILRQLRGTPGFVELEIVNKK